MAITAVFGADVVDDVDDVQASHVNNIRAWLTAFAPLLVNLDTVTTTDTSYTLSDSDDPYVIFDSQGTTDLKVYMPAESSDNHPFWIGCVSTDAGYTLTILSDSSDTLDTCAQYKFTLLLPTGATWLTL